MAIQTIVEPSADDQLREVYRNKVRGFLISPLTPSTHYVVCMMVLHPSVTTDDYPALKNAIEDIPGIVSASLMFDHTTRDTLPAGATLEGRAELAIVINGS